MEKETATGILSYLVVIGFFGIAYLWHKHNQKLFQQAYQQDQEGEESNHLIELRRKKAQADKDVGDSDRKDEGISLQKDGSEERCPLSQNHRASKQMTDDDLLEALTSPGASKSMIDVPMTTFDKDVDIREDESESTVNQERSESVALSPRLDGRQPSLPLITQSSSYLRTHLNAETTNRKTVMDESSRSAQQEGTMSNADDLSIRDVSQRRDSSKTRLASPRIQQAFPVTTLETENGETRAHNTKKLEQESALRSRPSETQAVPSSSAAEASQDDEVIGEGLDAGEDSDDERVVDEAKAMELKTQGNEQFKAAAYEQAIKSYNEALDCLPKKAVEQAAVIFSNMAAVHLAQQDWEEAKESASSAIEICPSYPKSYLRRYKAHSALDKLHDAVADLKKACDLDDAIRSTYRLELGVMERKSAAQFEKEKEEMMGKLKEFGNWALGKVGMSIDNFKVVQDPASGSYNIQYNPPAQSAPDHTDQKRN